MIIDLRPPLAIVGDLLLILAVVMLVPVLFLPAAYRLDSSAFWLSAFICAAAGLLLRITCRRPHFSLNPPQIFILTVTSWLAVGAFCALPLLLSDLGLSVTDAFFESISGITTTGSTVLSGLDQLPEDILLWRSLLQWAGGIGIVGMAVALFPSIGVGGMRLFLSESSEWTEKAMPRTRQLSKYLVIIYTLITVLCGLSYYFAGMAPFDAVNHAMTTVSSGGFSTSDSSMGRYGNPLILWVSVVFMIMGGLPFMLYVRALVNGERKVFARDAQVRGFLWLLLVVSLLLALWRSSYTGVGWWQSFTAAAFNVTSIVTTTGYASTDYTAWGSFAVVLFFALTFVGACSGSTSGGIKMFRFQLSGILLWEQIRRLIRPSAVLPRRYNGRRISDELAASTIAFSFVFFITIVLLAAVLAWSGLDLATSLSGAVTALANVGPGVGDVIGPAGNFSSLPDVDKWVLALGMILGRLELLTFLVLLTPEFWRG